MWKFQFHSASPTGLQSALCRWLSHENLTRFNETSPDQVRKNLSLEGDKLNSLANGKTFICGRPETPSLRELRDRYPLRRDLELG